MKEDDFETGYHRLARDIPNAILPEEVSEIRIRKNDLLSWLQKKFFLTYVQAQELLKYCRKKEILDFDYLDWIIIERGGNR